MIGGFFDDDDDEPTSELPRHGECERCEDRVEAHYLVICDVCEVLVCPDCRVDVGDIICLSCRDMRAGALDSTE